ncbi:zinc ribbon domain-containing protein [Shewanella sp. MEBiC00475]|uniref:zinc ribbon domain-containing protein n=1 Tax=Shewanella sp. MEBiC00475 TaxID=2575361 RepID=UPI001586AADD|nr:zinc ribbon domain-containing protein [Shewanella sp. MEBiC00475]
MYTVIIVSETLKKFIVLNTFDNPSNVLRNVKDNVDEDNIALVELCCASDLSAVTIFTDTTMQTRNDRTIQVINNYESDGYVFIGKNRPELTVVEDINKDILVIRYNGTHKHAYDLFINDKVKMKEYIVSEKRWTENTSMSAGAIIYFILCIILLLINLFIGAAFVLIGVFYFVISTKKGSLTVTYNKQETHNDKTCPQCAEVIKLDAKICRFCRYVY